jgi:hypothetical protein
MEVKAEEASGTPRGRHSREFDATVALVAIGQKTRNVLARVFGIHPAQRAQRKRPIVCASAASFEHGRASRWERGQTQPGGFVRGDVARSFIVL